MADFRWPLRVIILITLKVVHGQDGQNGGTIDPRSVCDCDTLSRDAASNEETLLRCCSTYFECCDHVAANNCPNAIDLTCDDVTTETECRDTSDCPTRSVCCPSADQHQRCCWTLDGRSDSFEGQQLERPPTESDDWTSTTAMTSDWFPPPKNVVAPWTTSTSLPIERNVLPKPLQTATMATAWGSPITSAPWTPATTTSPSSTSPETTFLKPTLFTL